MSLGYGGFADLQQSDDTMVIYLYCCYNVDNDEYKHFQQLEDGELYIDRDAFVEPEIHEKIRKTASGRKRTITKRVPIDFDLIELLESGKITVSNAGGTWQTTNDGIDIIAVKLLRKIFNEYQKTGDIPKRVGFYC